MKKIPYKGHCNHSSSIFIDLAVDLRHDCEEKVKVREHGRARDLACEPHESYSLRQQSGHPSTFFCHDIVIKWLVHPKMKILSSLTFISYQSFMTFLFCGTKKKKSFLAIQ